MCGAAAAAALPHGGYRIRIAAGEADLSATLALRAQVFRTGPGGMATDREPFDAVARHLLVEDVARGALVGSFRYFVLTGPGMLRQAYSARFYDLAPLRDWAFPLVEISRLCLAPGAGADLFRLMLGAMTAVADGAAAMSLFGVTTLGPASASGAGGALAVRRGTWPIVGCAPTSPPPLLATYLALGGWVGDRTATDPVLGTQVLFTALDRGDIPPGRARSLRALAAGLGPLDPS